MAGNQFLGVTLPNKPDEPRQAWQIVRNLLIRFGDLWSSAEFQDILNPIVLVVIM
jgi:hypothetical protein